MVILSGNTSVAMGAGENSPNVIKVDEQDHYHEDWIPPFQFRQGVCIKTNEKFSDYYELHEEIGEGKFGKVYRCTERSTLLVLAAKCIRLKRDADLQKVEKEVNIMTQMRHKCIAQIYDAFATSTNNDVILIMEIVQGGELFDRVVDESYILTEMAVAMIMHQICEAIRYIHSQNIIHLDLKPENIMCVSQTGNQIKLIDFGLAQYFDGQSDLLFMAGTPEFAAPEVIKYEPLDFHTDMWSVGVITYILLSGQSPFLGENIAHTYCNVERGKWEFCDEFQENCITPEAHDFISRLLVTEKDQRMLPDECLRHPWITLFRERSRNTNRPTERKLDVGKLRSYVRNKRFRRLVFGVLFINTIVRMMNTLQDRRSEHGIRYVKDMLGAVQPDPPPGDDVLTSSSSMENVQPGVGALTHSTLDKAKSTTGDILASESHTDVPNGSHVIFSMEQNNASATVMTTDQLSDSLVSTSEKETDGGSSPRLQQRRVLKSKRVKSDSRKASSTEQAPEKRTKASTPTAEQRVGTSPSAQIGSKNLADICQLPTEHKSSNSSGSVVPKIKKLSMSEEKTGAPLQITAAAAIKSSAAILKTVQTDGAKKLKSGPTNLQGTLAAFAKKAAPKTEKDENDTRQRILSATKVKKVGDVNDGSTEAATLSLPSTSKARSASPMLASQKKFKVAELDIAKKNTAEIPAVGKSPEELVKDQTDMSNNVETIKSESGSASITVSRPKKDPEEAPTSGVSKVNSLLRKLESNKNEAGGGITIAVAGHLPPKLSVIRRHGSAENLNTTPAADLFRHQKSYKVQGPHKTATLPPQTDDRINDVSSKKLLLKMEHKATHQHKTIVKTKFSKSTTLSSKSSGTAEEKCKESGMIVDETNSELTSVRQNLRSVITTPQNRGDTAVRPAQSDPTGLSSGTSKLIATFDNRLTKMTSDRDIQTPNGKCDKIITKVSKTEVSCERSAGLRQKEVAGQRAVHCFERATICAKKIGRKSSETDVVESTEVEAEKCVIDRALNSAGDGGSQSSKRIKKIVIKAKARTAKRPSDTKVEIKKAALSLNDVSNSDKSKLKGVTFSHEALLTEQYDWRTKRASVGDNLAIASKSGDDTRLKSEGDLSKKTKKDKKRSSSKTRSTHRPSDEFSFEYDAFDFTALRLKLQQRIMGAIDDASGNGESGDTQPVNSRLKCELRVQLPDACVVTKTRNKWLDMDKAASKTDA